MNNTNYATLIYNATTKKEFSHFEINFVNECVFNDEISVGTLANTAGEYITGSVNDKVVFNAYIK